MALARFREGQTASPEVGTKPAISEDPRKKTHRARPGAAIAGKATERVEFLFSTAIPDAAKKEPSSSAGGLFEFGG